VAVRGRIINLNASPIVHLISAPAATNWVAVLRAIIKRELFVKLGRTSSMIKRVSLKLQAETRDLW
jgi:hypothetical protein